MSARSSYRVAVNHDLPIMADDRLDYMSGSYEVCMKPLKSGAGFFVHHKVSGLNLVQRLLSGGFATFACEVSSPYTTYRKIVSVPVEDRESPGSDFTACNQEVPWNESDVLPPVYVRPLVLACVNNPLPQTLGEQDGVLSLWHGVSIEIRPGAILAMKNFWSSISTKQSLLRIRRKNDMPQGAYRVLPVTDAGFYFQVDMHPDLFHAMRNPGDRVDFRDAILTGALSSALDTLRREYSETDNDGAGSWTAYPTLQALRADMEEQGIPTWDEGDDFHADEAASRMKPVRFELESDGDAND